MIFVTVGTQVPFDRLIAAVDRWASEHPEHEVFAQIGQTDLEPAHIRWTRSLTPTEFDAAMRRAACVISHSGMGSILTALELGKRIVLMPRLARLGEHRNDHQLATASHFAGRPGVSVVQDEGELADALKSGFSDERVAIRSSASEPLLRTLRAFIAGESGDDT